MIVKSSSARACVLSIVTCVLVLAPGAGNAQAGEFEIGKCQADRLNFSTSGILDFATRGMGIRRACNPEGGGRRGLMLYSVPRAGKVRRGSRAALALSAPAGTSFSLVRWSGQICRGDRRYAIQFYAEGPGGRTVPIKNVRANRGRARGCDTSVSAGLPRTQTYAIGGTTRIIQVVRCVGSKSSPHCSARATNFIRSFRLYARVVDDTPPSVAILPDTPLARGEWVRGSQSLNYSASDNSGVRHAEAFVGGPPRVGSDTRACAYADRQGTYAAPVPCPNGVGQIPVGTPKAREGTQPLTVQAFDSADNPGVSAPVTARIDNTAPAKVLADVEGGQGWRNQNSYAVTWANGPEDGPQGDRAPITSAAYKLCAGGGASCSNDRRDELGISRFGVSVPAPGEWSLSVLRRDGAGNEEPSNSSAPVMLRYDPEPPQLGFEAPLAADPTRISVAVTDKYSGLASGSVEISRQGSGSWQTLATATEGARLVARIDDSQLAPGTYVLRSTARDGATNEASTDRRLDGQPMVLRVPLRIVSGLQAGVAKTRTVRATIKRRGKRRTVRRRVTVLKQAVRVGFGRRVQISGRLANSDGQGIAGAELLVYSRSATSAEQLAGTIRSGPGGQIAYTATATTTRTLRLVYAGTALILPAQQQVTLLVPGYSTLRLNRRRVLNGQSVGFRGRLGGLPAPPTGKLVELQARVCTAARGARCVAHRWQTFRTVRTDANGRWAVGYRFARSCGRARQHFRTRLPAEAGYPFETGHSRRVSVLVRGRPCR